MKNLFILFVLVCQPLFAQDFYSKIRLRDTTNATTATDGAMRIDGGLSVAKSIFSGETITVKRSGGPALVLQDAGGALGAASSPAVYFKDSTTTVGGVGYISPTTYDIQFVNYSGVGGFQWKQGSTMFAFADQNGIWQFNNGLGINTTATTSNIIHGLKSQDATTKAIISNQNSGSSAAAKFVASANAGDIEVAANSTASGAVAEFNVGSGFTGGTNLNVSSTNPYRIKTNSTTRLTVGGSSGEVQLEKPLILGQSATPSNPSSGYNKIYPKSDDKIYALSSGGTESELLTTASGIEPRENHLYNGSFSLWQRGTSFTTANSATAYTADRWYVNNALGTNAVITTSRQTGASDGAKYALKVLISTAPTAAQANTHYLAQTLENLDSLRLYNKTASFQVKVKAFGNVNQVSLQFGYKTTEGKIDTLIGSATTCTVTTASFTTCNATNQALSTSMTASGSIGVRVWATAVSSGNIYDLNNGFSVEQAMVVIGAAPSEFKSRFQSAAAELAAAQRFYEKSYDYSTDPGTASTFAGAHRFRHFNAGGDNTQTVYYKASKRSTPTIVIYNPNSGSTGTARDESGADRAASIDYAGFNSASILIQSITSLATTAIHWTADAEL